MCFFDFLLSIVGKAGETMLTTTSLSSFCFVAVNRGCRSGMYCSSNDGSKNCVTCQELISLNLSLSFSRRDLHGVYLNIYIVQVQQDTVSNQLNKLSTTIQSTCELFYVSSDTLFDYTLHLKCSSNF